MRVLCELQNQLTRFFRGSAWFCARLVQEYAIPFTYYSALTRPATHWHMAAFSGYFLKSGVLLLEIKHMQNKRVFLNATRAFTRSVFVKEIKNLYFSLAKNTNKPCRIFSKDCPTLTLTVHTFPTFLQRLKKTFLRISLGMWKK